jgi:hypothetical protein
MVTFGVALSAFVAQNYGAGYFSRIRIAVKKASLINIGLSIFMAIIMHNWGSNIVRIFIGSGNNHIELGIFESDNGCIWGDHGIYAYYPTLTFYNNLNRVGCNYNVGQPNNTRVKMTEQGMIINEENLLKAIRDSFDYIKIFEDK